MPDGSGDNEGARPFGLGGVMIVIAVRTLGSLPSSTNDILGLFRLSYCTVTPCSDPVPQPKEQPMRKPQILTIGLSLLVGYLLAMSLNRTSSGQPSAAQPAAQEAAIWRYQLTAPIGGAFQRRCHPD